MTPPPSEIGEVLARIIAKALDGPAEVLRGAAIATLKLAEILSSFISQDLATDLQRVKDSLVRKAEVEANSAQAEAQKKLADATKAANRANLHKRNDAIAKAQKAQKEAKAAKTQAEADAIHKNAETKRIKAIAEAKARLIEAIAKVREKGGDVIFDSKNLNELLFGNSLPPEDESDTENN